MDNSKEEFNKLITDLAKAKGVTPLQLLKDALKDSERRLQKETAIHVSREHECEIGIKS